MAKKRLLSERGINHACSEEGKAICRIEDDLSDPGCPLEDMLVHSFEPRAEPTCPVCRTFLKIGLQSEAMIAMYLAPNLDSDRRYNLAFMICDYMRDNDPRLLRLRISQLLSGGVN